VPQISLTTFVDFVSATATTRLTKVRAAKSYYEAGYGPERDFYGPLRKRIVEAFEQGWDPKNFDQSLGDVTDPKKLESYARARKGMWRSPPPLTSVEAQPRRRPAPGALCPDHLRRDCASSGTPTLPDSAAIARALNDFAHR
jgi:hypothetical protein